MIAVSYLNAKKLLLSGGLDLDTDTIKLALVQDTYVPDISHDYWSEVVDYEITPVGTYVAGGPTLTGAAVSEDAVNEEGVLDFTDVVFFGLDTDTEQVQYLVLYKFVDAAVTSPLIAYFDLETPVSYDGTQPVRIKFSADGIIRVL